MSAPKDTERACFLRLPSELLIQIIEAAALRTSPEIPRALEAPFSSQSWQCEQHDVYDYSTLKDLALTCRLFNFVATPFLYQMIILRQGTPARPSKGAVPFIQSVLRGPSTEWCCEALEYETYRTSLENEDGLGLSARFLNVKCLRIQSHFDLNLLQRFVQGFPRLEHLHLRGPYLRASVEDVINRVIAPHLSVLRLDCLDMAPDAFQIRAEKIRTASFTTVSLAMFSDDDSALRQLLLWPKTLENLSFYAAPGFTEILDLAMFQPILETFKDTLRTLEIFKVPWFSCDRPFDLSGFTALETLRLSSWRVLDGRDLTCLLAPRLKVIGFDITEKYQMQPLWHRFSHTHIHWLRDLGISATVARIPLNTIEIELNPDFVRLPANGNFEYPWDKFDRLNEELMTYGIAVKYSEPTITKAAWLETISGEENRS